MIDSKRLMLRRWQIEDAEAFFEQVDKNHHHLDDYFINLRKITSLEMSKEFLQTRMENWDDKSLFACGIFLKPEMKLIGHISVRDIDWLIPKGEIAYFIFKEFTGNHYLQEALIAFRDWCFEELKFNRLYLKIAQDNLASIKSALQAGFELEGTLKKDYRKGGKELVDMNIYGFVKNPISFSQSENK